MLARSRSAPLILTVVLTTLLGACAGTNQDSIELKTSNQRSTESSSSTQSTTTQSSSSQGSSTTTSTSLPKSTVAPPPAAKKATPDSKAQGPAPIPVLGPGAKGEGVLALEKRLAELRYDVGAIDGIFDENTKNAVIAFQKVSRLKADGFAGAEVQSAVKFSNLATPMLTNAENSRVEVDLTRQVLLLWINGGLERVLPISSGSGERFYVEKEDRWGVANTPGGRFKIFRRVPGWDKSPLGELYNPLYFVGGIAIHGAPSVPVVPASHGCVRIPMFSAEWFPNVVANGTPVYVFDGVETPTPFEPIVTSTLPTTVATTTTSSTTTTLLTITTAQSTTTSTESITTTTLNTPEPG